MSGDINSLGHQLNRFSERNRHFRDFTLYSLISTLKEVIACFPVYRSYITPDRAGQRRRSPLHRAGGAAGEAPHPRAAPPIVSISSSELLLSKDAGPRPDDGSAARARRFVGKFQQITSPVAAKGIEDTALYVYNRLLSLNEVGGEPTGSALEPADRSTLADADASERWPAALSATSTHDTKRGEDVRARLNVLSEMPDEWRLATVKWRALNRRFKRDVIARRHRAGSPTRNT